MPRGFLVLAIFVLVPLVEMYLLITVGGYLGALPTVGLVMLTAVIGVALLKRQGLATLARASERFNSGQLPAQEMAEGIMLAVAGALLLTPGFVTDGVGFALLVPPVRAWLAGQISLPVSMQGPMDMRGQGNPQGSAHNQGTVIEGEIVRRESDDEGH